MKETPFLSICIPTYNRSIISEGALSQLLVILVILIEMVRDTVIHTVLVVSIMLNQKLRNLKRVESVDDYFTKYYRLYNIFN